MKTKALILSFGLFVAAAGSVITIEDWQELSTVERIELVMSADELSSEQKNLLLAVLQSEHDDDAMRAFAADEAQSSRRRADAANSAYERERWEQAARFFANTEEHLRRLVAYENTYAELLEDFDNNDSSPELRESLQGVDSDRGEEINATRQRLHDDLLEAFIAVGLAERSREEQSNGTVAEANTRDGSGLRPNATVAEANTGDGSDLGLLSIA